MDDIDNTPYVTAEDIDGVIASLENASNTLFKMFRGNLLKFNANKCHLPSIKDKVDFRR